MTYINPLDLWNILINNLAGSVEIFVGLAFVVIIGLAAYFRMTTFTTLILLGLFFIVLSPYIGVVYSTITILGAAIAIGIVWRWVIQK